MPILDLQLRQRELGRIRIGRKADGKGHPQKLDKFRFTSASEELIGQIAALYGGKCAPWSNDGQSQFEVFTAANRLPILLPPQPISQWYEMWSGGGCQRRCDGRTNALNDSPCACPSDPLDRAELASKGRACKPTTRLNVVLRDVPGIGVWRLESHGYHSAVELPMVAEFLARATEAGTYLPAELALSPRSSKRPGEGKKEWLVPIIEVGATPRQLMSGDTGPKEVVGSTGRAALTAGPQAPDYKQLAAGAKSVKEWREVWNLARDNGHLDETLKAALMPIGQRLSDAVSDGAVDESEPVDAEIVESEADEVWALILENSPHDWNTARLNSEFASHFDGVHPSSATVGQMREFLAFLRRTNGAAA